MTRHVADQPRDRAQGARAREYARIQRQQGAEGPHPSTKDLQRRPGEAPSDSRRTAEFLRRKRERDD